MTVGDFGRGFHLLHDAEEIRRLDDDRAGEAVHFAFQVFQVEVAGFGHVAELGDGHALMFGVGGEHFAVLGVDAFGDQHAALAGGAHRHHGGLGHGGGAVVHGRVGHVHAGELADHGLKFEDGGERALRDLGLIGRVRGEELAARDHGIHQHGAEMVVHAGAEEAGVAVGALGRAVAEVIHNLVFGNAGRQIQRPVQPHLVGQVGEQLFRRTDAASVEHGAALGFGFRKISQLLFGSYICLIVGRRH